MKRTLYATQILLSVFTATVLIARICGTPMDSALFGAGAGTLIYELLTRFRSPMFISSCGATVAAVIACGGSYTTMLFGGLIIALVYYGFAYLLYIGRAAEIDRILPPIVVGSITMVIGANLAKFISAYVNSTNAYEPAVALLTMTLSAALAVRAKGMWKALAFLCGLLGGYAVALILTLCGVSPLVDLSLFNDITLLRTPDFAFFHLTTPTTEMLLTAAVLFLPVSIASFAEHLSDHRVLSNIMKRSLYKDPGLPATLLGDGTASFFGTLFCGLPNTSYGESVATMGLSRQFSTANTTFAAIGMVLLSFLHPIQQFIASIPSAVFGGGAMILYGYIFASGLKTIIAAKVDLEDTKNLIVLSVILTIGISGIFFLHSAFTGVSLALAAGVLVNLIL